MENISALIVSDNAEATIERAIYSALPQVAKVLVVDNASVDATVARVQAVQRKLEQEKSPQTGKLQLFCLPGKVNEGEARQYCLQQCATPWAAWLRYCDEFLPQRIATLAPFLKQGYAWVFDNIELCELNSTKKLGRTIYPDFVRDKDGISYQFARNYIRGEGIPLVNVQEALKIGYRSLQNVSNYDHFLRAIIASGKIKIHHSVTYRKYLDRETDKREKQAQREESKAVLKSIGLAALDQHLQATSLTEAQKFEIKLFYLSNTDDWQGIRKLLLNKPRCNTPYFSWLVYFMESVADYMLGDIELSLQHIHAALAVQRRPESLNNLAVCEARAGHEYKNLLEEALAKSPGYLDALFNREVRELERKRITPVPLRGLDIPEFIGASLNW